MDVGTGQVIAAAILVIGPMFQGWLARRAQAKDARELKSAVVENTKLTAQIQGKTDQTYHEMNSMKDALVKATGEAADAQGQLKGVAAEQARIAALDEKK